MATAHAPLHPGEILLEEFRVALGISQYRLAQAIGVPIVRGNSGALGRALKLGRNLAGQELGVR